MRYLDETIILAILFKAKNDLLLDNIVTNRDINELLWNIETYLRSNGYDLEFKKNIDNRFFGVGNGIVFLRKECSIKDIMTFCEEQLLTLGENVYELFINNKLVEKEFIRIKYEQINKMNERINTNTKTR